MNKLQRKYAKRIKEICQTSRMSIDQTPRISMFRIRKEAKNEKEYALYESVMKNIREIGAKSAKEVRRAKAHLKKARAKQMRIAIDTGTLKFKHKFTFRINENGEIIYPD